MILKLLLSPRNLLLVILMFGLGKVQAQKTEQVHVRDLEAWSSVSLKWEATKRFSLELEEQLRLKEDASITDIYFTQLGASYKLNKHFSIGAAGRYITDNDNVGKKQGYDNFFRYQVDVTYRHKLKRFGLKYRLRYQNKNELGLSEAQGDVADTRLRFKTSLKYNIKKTKWTPTVAVEIFRKDKEGDPVEFNKFRLTTGLGYEFKKIGEIGFFYRMERDLNVTYPKTSNIVGFKYGYTIKRKKKKKEDDVKEEITEEENKEKEKKKLEKEKKKEAKAKKKEEKEVKPKKMTPHSKIPTVQ